MTKSLPQASRSAPAELLPEHPTITLKTSAKPSPPPYATIKASRGDIKPDSQAAVSEWLHAKIITWARGGA